MSKRPGVVAGAVIAGIFGLIAAWIQIYPHLRADTQDQTKEASAPQPRVPLGLETQFYPSGWMGDGKYGKEHISLSRTAMDVRGETKVVVRIEYRPGPEGWAGVYWQFPENNWGDHAGRNLTGVRAIRFLARGEEGGEIVEFKAGGIRGKNPDSFEKSLDKLILAPEWSEHTIQLTGEDLSNVVGAFAWIAAAADNENLPISFYICDMVIL